MMTKRMTCEEHGEVEAYRSRGSVPFGTDPRVEVHDVAVYVCPICAKVIGIPHTQSGRFASAIARFGSTRTYTVGITMDVEDLAFEVATHLGAIQTDKHPLHAVLWFALSVYPHFS